jgi:hypothetical protein
MDSQENKMEWNFDKATAACAALVQGGADLGKLVAVCGNGFEFFEEVIEAYDLEVVSFDDDVVQDVLAVCESMAGADVALEACKHEGCPDAQQHILAPSGWVPMISAPQMVAAVTEFEDGLSWFTISTPGRRG